MNPTRYKPPSSQSIYKDISSDDYTEIFNRRDAAQDFRSQLTSIIGKNQAGALQQLVQQHRETWSLVSPEELGKWLLIAVKKGHLDIVDALIRESAPATVAAISLDMQLELVEAARFERNSGPEMSFLLDALLRTVNCPVQHLALLVDRARGEKYFAIATSLFTYKENFVKERNKQPLQSIYDAAADGDAARLRKELDAALGIPPLDERLTGAACLINMLVHWLAEIFTAGAAETLVNEEMGKLPLLHVAVMSGDKKTVLLLIEKGASTSAADKDGRTALSRAKEQKDAEIIELLQKLGAPDRASFPIGALAPTQAAGGISVIAGQARPHHEERTDTPGYSDTVASFKNLLPNVASLLSASEDLARELNGATRMTAEQAGLFMAGYLAEFEPPQAVDGQKSRRALVPRSHDVAFQLQANRDNFRAEGWRLEASRTGDIHGVLDSVANTEFADVWTNPGYMEHRLRNAGLCNLLIACVMQAAGMSRGNPDWLSATAERRKEIFAACLRRQLRGLSEKRSAIKEESASQALYDQLLRRQFALLENYCWAVGNAYTDHAVGTTDFSDYFY